MNKKVGSFTCLGKYKAFCLKGRQKTQAFSQKMDLMVLGEDRKSTFFFLPLGLVLGHGCYATAPRGLASFCFDTG